MSNPKVDKLPDRYAKEPDNKKPKKKSLVTAVSKAAVKRLGADGVNAVVRKVSEVINKKGGDAVEKVAKKIRPGAKALRGKELAEANKNVVGKVAGVEVTAGAASAGVDIAAMVAKEFAGGDVTPAEYRKLASALEKLQKRSGGELPTAWLGSLIRKLAEGENAETNVQAFNTALDFAAAVIPPIAVPGVPIPIRVSWIKTLADIALKKAVSYAPEEWGEDKVMKQKEWEEAIRAEAKRLEEEIQKTLAQIKADEEKKALVPPTKIIPGARPAPAANNKKLRKKK